jgi:hypothetical protein
MSVTINRSGGGGGLAIKVMGGSTQPTSAPEKTIWVNTSTAITSYVFSSDEPTTPAAGMVWIKTGTTSPVAFNAVKNNVVMIYPSQCKQYENGAWAAKEAKSYLNGVWVTWVVTTYWFTAGTGPTDTWNRYATGDGAASVSTTRMQLFNEYNTSALISSTAAIDFTLFSRLHIDAEADGSSNGTFGLASSIPSGSTSVTFANSVYQSSRTRAVWELDISDMSGSYYIALRASGAGSVFVYNIYAD